MAEVTLSDISEKMRDIDFAMFSTRTADGAIASRPMSNNRQVEYDGDNFFFTTTTPRPSATSTAIRMSDSASRASQARSE